MRRNALGSVCFLTILVCVVCKDGDLKPFTGNQAFPRSHSVRVRSADEQESPHISVDDIGRSGYPIYDSWEDFPTYGLGAFGSPVYTHSQASAQAHSNDDAAAKAENYYDLGYPGYRDSHGIAYGQSNAQSLSESDAYAYGESDAQAIAQSNVQGLGQSKAFALAEGNIEAIAQSNAQGLLQSDAYALAEGNSQSVAQSNVKRLGQSNAYAITENNVQAVAHSNAKGLGLSDAYAYSESNAKAVSQSNAEGLAQSDSYAFAENNAHKVAQSNAQDLFESNYKTQYSEPILEIPMYYQYGPYGSVQSDLISESQDLTKSEGLRALGSVVEEPLNTEQYTDESKFGLEQSLANAFSGAYSRVIPRGLHIMPHLMPGGKNIIRCSEEGEIHNFWSPVFDCMVCVCLKDGYSLMPVCVKCNCAQHEHMAPVVEEPAVMQPVVPTPLPTPESQVSCDPLPTDTPYESPTNPCQICVCQRSINSLGQPDIRITCEENPECLVPPQPLPQPPLIPIHLTCDDYPVNVPFQHPTDVCSICVCVLRDFDYNMVCQPDPECEVKPMIMPELIHPTEPLPAPIPIHEPLPPSPIPEQPQPVPVPYPEPVPEVYPEPMPVYPEPEVYPEPIPDIYKPDPHPEIIRETIPFVYPEPAPQVIHPFEPIPELHPEHPEPYPELYPEPYPEPVLNQEPEIIVPEVLPAPKPEQDVALIPEDLPEPVPWPPAVPSPLPGPPPHESCHPYPPNTPFQHPWDVCQICVCAEVISANIINIEVNCYTSKLCCIEPPFSGPVLQPLGIYGPPTSHSETPAHIKFIDKICEHRSLEVNFVNPNDACKTCKCEVYGNLVVPVCKRAAKPECAVTPVSQSGDVVYIEPRCRHRVPSQYFRVEGSICVCEPIYRYVIAKCVKLRLNAGVPQPEGGASKVILPPYGTAQFNAADSWQRPIIPSYPSTNLPAASYPLFIPSHGYDSSISPYYWLQNYPGMVSDAQPHNSGLLKPSDTKIIRPSNEFYLDQLNYDIPSDAFYPSYLGPINSESTHSIAHSVSQNNDGPNVYGEPSEEYTPALPKPVKLHDYEVITKPNIHPVASNLYDEALVQHPLYILPTNAPVNIGQPHLNYDNLYDWNPYDHLQIHGSSQPHILNDVNTLHLNAGSNAEADAQTESTINSYYNLMKNIYNSNYISQNNGQPHGIPYNYYNYGDVLRNKNLNLYSPYYFNQNNVPMNVQADSQSVSEIGQSDAHAVAGANEHGNSAQSNAHSNKNILSHKEAFLEGDTSVNALTNALATQDHILANHHHYPYNDVLLPSLGATQINTQVSADTYLQSDALGNAMANAQANVLEIDQLKNTLAKAQANSQHSSTANAQYFSQANAHANSLSDAQAISQANVQAHGGDSQAFAQANSISNAKNYPPIYRNVHPSNLAIRPRLFGNRWRYVGKSGNPDDAKSADDELPYSSPFSAENDRELSSDNERLNSPEHLNLKNILTPISITIKPEEKADEKTLTTRPERQDASEVFDHHLPNTQKVERHESTSLPTTPPVSMPLLQTRRLANLEAFTVHKSPQISKTPLYSTIASEKSGESMKNQRLSKMLPVSTSPALQHATKSGNPKGSNLQTTMATKPPMHLGSTMPGQSDESSLSTTPALSTIPVLHLNRRSGNSKESSSPTTPVPTSPALQSDTRSESTEVSTLSLGTTRSENSEETTVTTSLPRLGTTRSVNLGDSNTQERR